MQDHKLLKHVVNFWLSCLFCCWCLLLACRNTACDWSELLLCNLRILVGRSFCLPGGGALGCAIGRFGSEIAAHMTCQREKQGPARRRGTVVYSAGGDRKEERE